jgi:hypothetical protein
VRGVTEPRAGSRGLASAPRKGKNAYFTDCWARNARPSGRSTHRAPVFLEGAGGAPHSLANVRWGSLAVTRPPISSSCRVVTGLPDGPGPRSSLECQFVARVSSSRRSCWPVKKPEASVSHVVEGATGDPSAGPRSGLCTTRVTSARLKGSFRVGPCRGVSPELAEESQQVVEALAYPCRLSRWRSRVRVPSTPPFSNELPSSACSSRIGVSLKSTWPIRSTVWALNVGETCW